MHIYAEHHMLVHAVFCFFEFIYPPPMLQNPNKNLRFNLVDQGKKITDFSNFQYYLLIATWVLIWKRSISFSSEWLPRSKGPLVLLVMFSYIGLPPFITFAGKR